MLHVPTITIPGQPAIVGFAGLLDGLQNSVGSFEAGRVGTRWPAPITRESQF